MTGAPLRIVVVLKTAEGGLWTVPHIKELCRRGHRVVAVLPPGGRLRAALRDLPVDVVDAPLDFRFGPRLETLRGLVRLRRLLRSLRPDVVHYHLYASALAARLATVGLRIRRVHMVAGPLYLESRLIRTFERALCRLDHLTIGGSEYTSRRYRALGLSEARTPAQSYGIDLTSFQPPTETERAKARAELGLDDATFMAIMVAYVYGPKRSVFRGQGIKGHDVLLEAWQRFVRDHPDARLVIVGGGFGAAGQAHLEELRQRYAVAADPSITWVATVDDVRSYYRAADVSVSPSRSDNHGAAVEAGAMGVPSIVSDAGALPETVAPGSGWIVAAGHADALEETLIQAHAAFGDGSLRTRGALARHHIARSFELGRASARVADLIETAAGRPTTGRVPAQPTPPQPAPTPSTPIQATPTPSTPIQATPTPATPPRPTPDRRPG
jgi:glycosyltransferase involved in cell wall biosynthesis